MDAFKVSQILFCMDGEHLSVGFAKLLKSGSSGLMLFCNQELDSCGQWRLSWRSSGLCSTERKNCHSLLRLETVEDLSSKRKMDGA